MTTAGAIALGAAIGAVAVGIAWVVVSLRGRGGGEALAKVIKLQADKAKEAKTQSNKAESEASIEAGDEEIEKHAESLGDGPGFNERAGFEPHKAP